MPPTTKISELVGSKFYIKIPSATITTEQLEQADVNGDGLINNKDAEMIMQKDAGTTPEGYIEGTGDVDGSGEVNYSDATKVLQYIQDYVITQILHKPFLYYFHSISDVIMSSHAQTYIRIFKSTSSCGVLPPILLIEFICN